MICAFSCSILVFGAPAKDKENAEVKFTARAQLVLIPTLVTDKSGHHISGLKAEDFTVLENGVPQKIATFEEITSKPQPPPRTPNPNEFSNYTAGDQSARRIIVVVLDLINTPFTDQAYARQQLLKYLTQSLDQHEPTALYVLTHTGLRVVHDFTSDPRVLVAALHKAKGDAYRVVDNEQDVEAATGTASPDGSAAVDPAAVQTESQRLQTLMEDSEVNFRSFQQRLAITYTLEGMQQVAQTLTGFPGRKALIWASGGFPFSVSDNTYQLAPAGRDSLIDVLPMYEHTWQLLNDAQIALYPVDVKGLQTVVMPGASVSRPGANYSRNMSWRNIDTQATFQTFAAMTGGRAYYNSNDLAKGFREAVNDSAEYYMLGYYLDRSNTKPGWRKLSVKVKRDHVDVRARNGFFVTATTIDPANSRSSDISTALDSPLDFTALPVMARWVKTEAGSIPGKRHVSYVIHLPVDPALINEADNNHVSLEFVAAAKTSEGKMVEPPAGKKIDIHLPADKMAAVRKAGLGYTGSFDLAPGEYTARFVVRDDLGGRVGSVAAPLKVE
ncbi:MAG: VWA domain-containing protein [Acidobacteriales bacterium]|nr:VWA domain-containing protein [Terriglobales bacterium]